MSRTNWLSDLDAERAVLAHVLLLRRGYSDLMDAGLAPDDFTNSAHQAIWAECAKQGGDIDCILLDQALRADSGYRQAGGRAYLDGLVNDHQGTSRALPLASTLKELSRRRSIARDARALAASAETPEADLAEVESRIASLQDGATAEPGRRPASMKEAVADTYAQLMDLMDKPGRILGHSTGIPTLDRTTAGLVPGNHTILAGYTGLGKTALALQIARTVAKQGIPTLIFELEMTRQELTFRQLAAESCIDGRLFRGIGKWSPEDKLKAHDAMGKLSELPLYIWDHPGLSIADFRAVSRMMKTRHGIGLIIIDYVQLMRAGYRTESRRLEMAEISMAIKNIAKELHLPTVALSQFNRKGDEDGEPRMSFLAESSALENDADTVMLMWSERSADGAQVKPIHIRIRKNRHGEDGVKFTLMFHRRFLRFHEQEHGGAS